MIFKIATGLAVAALVFDVFVTFGVLGALGAAAGVVAASSLFWRLLH